VKKSVNISVIREGNATFITGGIGGVSSKHSKLQQKKLQFGNNERE